MKTILFPLGLLASFCIATDPTSTTTAASSDPSCAAEYIVDACLDTENAKLASCGTNDYDCSCNAYTDILTCFNNCPGDSRLNSYQGQEQIYCSYASQFPSSTATQAANATAASGSHAATTTTGSAEGTATGTSTKTTSGSSDGGTKTDGAGTGTGTGTSTESVVPSATSNGAAGLVLNASGIAALIAGVAAALL